jgi:hypothetical protein
MMQFGRLSISTTTLLVGLIVGVGGCGGRNLPDMGTVSGIVTVDGKPLPKATVRFFPASGRPSQAITRDDGSYELCYIGGDKGALLGEHRVTISTYMMDEDMKTHRMVNHPEILPEKYHAKSELSRIVEPRHNEFNFELTSQ